MSDIGSELEDFVHSVEGDMLQVGQKAFAWVENKLVGYGIEVLSDLKDLVVEAINDAEEGMSTEQLVTKLLNLAESRGKSLILEIETDVLAAVVALGKVIPS